MVRTRQYQQVRDKRVKTFLATWRPVGGVIRVVLVQEDHGWLALFSTEASLTAEEILASAADRFSIEQDFHDLKEVEGLGQQQLRDIWANVGAFHISAWVHTLVELWAWSNCARRSATARRRRGTMRGVVLRTRIGARRCSVSASGKSFSSWPRAKP